MTETLTTALKVQGLGLNITNQLEFALALKTWRLRQAYTQEEVGNLFGCSRYTIIRAESGKKLSWETTYRLISKLAYYLQKEQYETQRK
jgi:transcriptional regulator with XRE-family HTH domain